MDSESAYLEISSEGPWASLLFAYLQWQFLILARLGMFVRRLECFHKQRIGQENGKGFYDRQRRVFVFTAGGLTDTQQHFKAT